MEKNPLKQPLGELEAEIMKVIWACNCCCVREVLKKINKRKKLAYTTVMTVMGRLYEKRLLKRHLNDSGAYVYEPVQDKENFLAKSSKKAINSLLAEYGDVAVAQFLDILEAKDFKEAENWRKKLKKVK